MTTADDNIATSPSFDKKKLVFILVGIIGLIYLANWLVHRMGHVQETDARIKSAMTIISSTVPGRLTDFGLSEGDTISQGDVLAIIDRRQSNLKLAELDNQLKTVQAQLRKMATQKAMIDVQTSSHKDNVSSRLDVVLAGADSAVTLEKQTYDDWQRAKSLWDQKMIAQQRVDQAHTTHLQAVERSRASRAEVAAAQAALAEATAGQQQVALLDQDIVLLKHQLESVQLQWEQQQQDLQDRTITSPVDAIVDKTFVHQSEFVVPGQRLMLIHDPSRVWVEANVKETAVKKLAVGQSVKIHVDAFPDLDLTGSVANIGSAATSQFALIPTPNPSGNFIKVTQRLPIKIEIDDVDPRLKPGMMVEVDIVISND